MSFSIKDKLNQFGKSTASGDLPDTIYVGNKDMITDPVFNSEGGQISIPYFVEFIGDADVATKVTLKVLGKDEGAADTAYRVVGTLEIPAGQFKAGAAYRVGISDSTCKTFKCNVDAGGISAALFRG